MAKRGKSNKQKKRALSYGVLIPFLVGLIALMLQIWAFPDAGPVLSNILNWFVGIGFVGGILSMLVVFGGRSIRGERLW